MSMRKSVIEMIDRADEILRSLEGEEVNIKGFMCMIENGCVIYNYKNTISKKLKPGEMTRGQLEELLEFLDS